MNIWEKGSVFGDEPNQRARVLTVDTELKTLIIRSCGNDALAEIKPEDVIGVEITDNCDIRFKVHGVSWST